MIFFHNDFHPIGWFFLPQLFEYLGESKRVLWFVFTHDVFYFEFILRRKSKIHFPNNKYWKKVDIYEKENTELKIN